MNGDTNLIEFLESQDAKKDDKMSLDPCDLVQACESGRLGLVKWLFEHPECQKQTDRGAIDCNCIRIACLANRAFENSHKVVSDFLLQVKDELERRPDLSHDEK